MPEYHEGDFAILIDTREAHPWTPPDGVPYSVQALPIGDYSLACHGPRVAIERKSLDDYVRSVFGEWRRFSAELRKLGALECRAVIVESDPDEIRAGKYRPGPDSPLRSGPSAAWARYLDRLEPAKVIGSAATIHGAFGVPVVWAESPGRAEAYAWNMLRAWWKAERARREGV